MTYSLQNIDSFKSEQHIDNRGCFVNIFREGNDIDFKMHNILQVNLSSNSQKGTVRGLHFQKSKFAEFKKVFCLSGSIFDVIVDVRRDSPNFLRYKEFLLSSKGFDSVIIPKGFAHGFQTLEDNTQVLYLHTNVYNKENEFGINAQDPTLSISWPLEFTNISDRDLRLPMSKDMKFDADF